MTTASSKAKHHADKARTLLLQGRIIEAHAELKMSTKWKGITKRKKAKHSVDAMLQSTIVYPFDLETYS
jgi:hypothetical protein